MFKSIFTIIIEIIQKSLEKGSGWVICPVTDHTISISKYNPLAGSSYIKLPKELDHPRKGLINIHNIDDSECFKWCLVRYLNSGEHSPRRIRKSDKNFAKRLDFKDINFQPKLETLVLLAMKIKKNIQSKYNKECYKVKNVDLLLIGEGGKTLCSYERFQYIHV